MLRCDVCESSFEPLIENHYISRSNSRAGIVTAFVSDETTLHDSFDCPYCGCQVHAKTRERRFIELSGMEYDDTEDDDVEGE